MRSKVFRRADDGNWQFITGGGEDDETPQQAARGEARSLLRWDGNRNALWELGERLANDDMP